MEILNFEIVRDYMDIKNQKEVIIENDYPYSNIPELPLCECLIIKCHHSLRLTDDIYQIGTLKIESAVKNTPIDESNFFETLYDNENIYLLRNAEGKIIFAGSEINCYRVLKKNKPISPNIHTQIQKADEYLQQVLKAGKDILPICKEIIALRVHKQNKGYNLTDHFDQYIQKQLVHIITNWPIQQNSLQQFTKAFRQLQTESIRLPKCRSWIEQHKAWINILMNYSELHPNQTSISHSQKI